MNRREILVTIGSSLAALIGVLTALFSNEQPEEDHGGKTFAPRNF